MSTQPSDLASGRRRSQEHATIPEAPTPTSLDQDTESSENGEQEPMLSSEPDSFQPGSDPQADPGKETQGSSVRDLTKADLWNLIVLFLLYFSQGLIVGLIAGTVPVLLKPHLAYAEVGYLGLALYPYSGKLLWSPLIDGYWFKQLGRRKSWIVPTEVAAGLVLIALGLRTPSIMEQIERHELHAWILYISVCFCLIFLFASQGCATDGWAVTLLPESKAHCTSIARTMGMTLGMFLTYTLYLVTSGFGSFRSPRPTPEDGSEAQLGNLTTYLGLYNLLCGLAVWLFTSETTTAHGPQQTILQVYKVILDILSVSAVRQLSVVHLLSGIGFEVNDAATSLKLLDKGFGQKNIAISAAVNLPFDLSFGIIAASLCVRYSPTRVWTWSFVVRLVAALLGQLTVAVYPTDVIPAWYLLLAYSMNTLSATSATAMGVALTVFHLQVSDLTVGGTYMTLLGTAQGLGAILPRIFILKAIDMTGKSECILPDGVVNSGIPATCSVPDEVNACTAGGGKCHIIRDGYNVTNVICVAFGSLIFWTFLRRKMQYLQSLPREAWALKET